MHRRCSKHIRHQLNVWLRVRPASSVRENVSPSRTATSFSTGWFSLLEQTFFPTPSHSEPRSGSRHCFDQKSSVSNVSGAPSVSVCQRSPLVVPMRTSSRIWFTSSCSPLPPLCVFSSPAPFVFRRNGERQVTPGRAMNKRWRMLLRRPLLRKQARRRKGRSHLHSAQRHCFPCWSELMWSSFYLSHWSGERRMLHSIPYVFRGVSVYSFECVEVGKDESLDAHRTDAITEYDVDTIHLFLVLVFVHRRNRSMWIAFDHRLDVFDSCISRSGSPVRFRTYAQTNRH